MKCHICLEELESDPTFHDRLDGRRRVKLETGETTRSELAGRIKAAAEAGQDGGRSGGGRRA
eukprot:4806501-Pyramimonas_sp.AAC.1